MRQFGFRAFVDQMDRIRAPRMPGGAAHEAASIFFWFPQASCRNSELIKLTSYRSKLLSGGWGNRVAHQLFDVAVINEMLGT